MSEFYSVTNGYMLVQDAAAEVARFRAFAFVIALAAVINGMGLARLLGGFAEYLRSQKLQVRHYWVYGAWVCLQFLWHVLLWWSMWGLQTATRFNFFIYLYFLIGPTLLFLGTSLLLPEPKEHLDLREHYHQVAPAYLTIGLLWWVWALFVWPVLAGAFRPWAPVFAVAAAVMLAGRFSRKSAVHGWVVSAQWGATIAFILWAAIGLDR